MFAASFRRKVLKTSQKRGSDLADRRWLALACVVLTPGSVPGLIRNEPSVCAACGPWRILCHTAISAQHWLLWLTRAAGVFWWRFLFVFLFLARGGAVAHGKGFRRLSDALTLRNLRGGGAECEQGPARRFCHNALVFGFALCFRRDGGGCHLSSCLGFAGALSDHERAPVCRGQRAGSA